MTLSKLKSLIPAVAALLLPLTSCVNVDYSLGANLLPVEQNYDVYVADIPIESIELRMADSLSGFSSGHVVVGAIRDVDGYVSRRACAVTIVPERDSISFGEDPIFKSFRLSIAPDTMSVADMDQTNILQTIHAYELDEYLDPDTQFNSNAKIPHGNVSVLKKNPFIAGGDSLVLDFTEDFGKKFFAMSDEDFQSAENYFKKIPGIYLECPDPVGRGGRINCFDHQLSIDSDYGYLVGNYGIFSFSAKYDGERVDTSFVFYLGAQDLYDLDSLLSETTTGVDYPQYAFNHTDEEDVRHEAGFPTEKIHVRGGGGLKPVISAAMLKDYAVKEILKHENGDPLTAVINKATIYLPFEFPDDYTTMFRFSEALSPTTRIHSDTSSMFVGLTDASCDTEDQGDIDRNNLRYSPDFSYHMQELLHTADSTIAKGVCDIWLLTMDYETAIEDNSNEDLAEMYEQLAYQSYYSSMYSGSGYSSNSYSNYYNYMMMAQYAANNITSYSTLTLNRDSYYDFYLNGPQYSDEKQRPSLRLVISIPKVFSK